MLVLWILFIGKEQPDFTGPRSHMSSYIQEKYNEMRGLFVLFFTSELNFDHEPRLLILQSAC